MTTVTETLTRSETDNNRSIRFLESLVQAYSPSGQEESIAWVLQEELESHGVSVRRDDVGNVIGEIGHGTPRILLCGHMDTVPGKIPVQIEEGKLYGRGSVDAKASLSALALGGINAVKANPDDLHVTILGVVEEETSTKGIKSFLVDHPPFDYAIFGEPSGSRNITVGYKGHLPAGFDFTTLGGHSASPWLSRNSFDEAVRFWTILESDLFENGADSKFNSLTGSVTQMTAGDATNTVPRFAHLELDIRIPPILTIEDVISRLDSISAEFQAAAEGQTTVSGSFRNGCPPFLEKTDSICARAFGMAIRRVTGQQATMVKKTGTSDMNLLAESYKIPMVAYGPGDSSLDHTDNEHVMISEYLESIEVCSHAIGNLVRLYSNKPQLIVQTA